MNIKRVFFSYFWQVLLAVGSLYVLYEGLKYETGIWWLMTVPLLAALFSVWLVRKFDLDLSGYFAKRSKITFTETAIVAGIWLIIPDLFFGLILNFLAPIPLIIMLFINVLYFIIKCDDLHMRLALSLADPIIFFIIYLLTIYLS